MGICCKENQAQKIEKENCQKRDPENNQKINKEINSKIVPETNPKLLQKTNIKIFTDQKEDLKKKGEENKIQPPESKKKRNSNAQNQLLDEHPSVPHNLLLEALKSICKIIIKIDYGQLIGTGFFMKVNDSKKYLVTNYHIISHKRTRTNEDILLHLSNEKEIGLNLKNRRINYFREIDITSIEIKDCDEICNEIKFLTYDLNYILGYEIYKNGYVFMVGYPHGEESCGTGKIVNVEKYEFYHTIPSSKGPGEVLSCY